MATNEKGYVDPLLTGFVVDYAANLDRGFIGRKLFPIVSVEKDDAQYPFFSKENFVTPDDNINDFEGEARRADLSSELKHIHCIPHALREGIDVRKNRQMDGPFKVKERAASRRLSYKLLTREELRIADLVKAHSNGQTLAGTGSATTNQWANGGGDPFAVADAAKTNMWFEPNTLVLSYDVYLALKKHTKVLEKLGANEAKIVTAQTLAELFEVNQVLVGSGRWAGPRKKNDKSVAMTRIWSNLAAFAYVDPEDQAVTCGKIFLERHEAVDADGFLVRTWHDATKGVEGTDVVQVGLVSSEAIVAVDCLYVVKSVLA